MGSHRWRPPLPSLGRMGGAPVTLRRGESPDVLQCLQDYFSERKSVSDMFECRIQPHALVRAGFDRGPSVYLSECSPSSAAHIILKSLYFKASHNFKMKLRMALQKKGGLSRVRQWFHTANGVVIPLLLTQSVSDYKAIDHLTRWCLENCANNYAQFQRDLKSLKKAMRKASAISRTPSCTRSMRTYLTYFRRKSEFSGPQDWYRYVLIWTQTRGTGLADGTMVQSSVLKFIKTITTPVSYYRLDPIVLNEVVKGAVECSPRHARISVGTTSCLEKTRKEGGKSAHLAELCRRKVLTKRYDYVTLESEDIDPRPVRSSDDVVQWALASALRYNTYTRCIRVHTVVEPGKARTITVAPYNYQVLMGVFAHIFQATLKARGLVSGLTKDRHMWRFLSDQMNPQNTLWENLTPGETVYACCTDFSEATDFGNPHLARQVWSAFISLARVRPNFPVGLAALAMNLYCGKRHIFVPRRGKYQLVTATRGWFMGDMMTKVILTVVHDYTMRFCGLKVYSLVGDDEVVLSNERARLARHLSLIEEIGLRVSREDTWISHRFMFYCEEGALVPQRPTQSLHVKMRRSEEIGYIDYPRIRLMLAETSETDSYSMTNIGRFALLGKEARWVHNVNPQAIRVYEIAGLIQHILVPQDSDTLCPYTPLEIGGDGAYTGNPYTAYMIVNSKARDRHETLFRMESLMNSSFAYRFVRSDRYNEVVHKHHLLLPALEEVRKYLPDSAVLVPRNDNERALLESVRVRGLQRPQQTWLQLCRGYYWNSIFRGEKPLEPRFDLQKKFSGGSTREPHVDMRSFVRHWANPGFRFANHEPYFVRSDEVELVDPLHLPWEWGDMDTLKYPSAFSLYSSWMQEQDFTQDLTSIIDLIQRDRPLPDRVVKRLNLFMESDNYILSRLPKEPRDQFWIVTRDFKLCAEIQRRLSQRHPKWVECWVYALDPACYLTGRYDWDSVQWHENVIRPSPGDLVWVEDPGSILHCDYTEFTDGFPHDEGIWDKPLRGLPHRRFDCVVTINMVNF